MLSDVIVSESPDYPFDRNPDMLISGVIFYVNTAVRSGGFPYAQLPRDAARLYWMDYYVAQVRNGGHSQYIYNSELSLIGLSYAREGFVEAGMNPLVAVFDDFLAWLKHNRERAQEETGFGAVAHELKAFDQRLYDFGSGPYSKAVAAWIMGWPGLRIVAPDDRVASIERAIDDAYSRHPEHLWRRQWARASTLGKPHHQLSIAQTLCAHARPAIQFEGIGIWDTDKGALPRRLERLINKARSLVNTAMGRVTFPEDLRHALDPYRMEAATRGRLNFSPIRTSAGFCGVCMGANYTLVSYKGQERRAHPGAHPEQRNGGDPVDPWVEDNVGGDPSVSSTRPGRLHPLCRPWWPRASAGQLGAADRDRANEGSRRDRSSGSGGAS
jgi:hypothetical protein